MRRVHSMLLLITLTVAAVTGIGADTASARAASPSSASSVQRPAEAGAPQRPVGAINLAPGVDLLLPSSELGPLHDGHNVSGRGCPFYHLCVWRDINFGGYGLGFYHCARFDLAAWGFPPGTNNGVSSVVNNQTEGTFSYFYDAAEVYTMTTMAPEAIPWVGDRGFNDLARYVDVC